MDAVPFLPADTPDETDRERWRLMRGVESFGVYAPDDSMRAAGVPAGALAVACVALPVRVGDVCVVELRGARLVRWVFPDGDGGLILRAAAPDVSELHFPASMLQRMPLTVSRVYQCSVSRGIIEGIPHEFVSKRSMAGASGRRFVGLMDEERTVFGNGESKKTGTA